ncbi:type IV toxin-antitoxin system AbiEi family antitoxin [Pedobacter psychrodurus]|uniref:type IV toxin-antitoxin system AbiEi family antitoxin n=1 Tax=Pedobacter psychrodurus TaxID=2530456 RepID=UPI00292D1E6A|nr:type IV toxin-antitoxin system AbiEi family antitoxin [Pedobacter psychrodurus]
MMENDIDFVQEAVSELNTISGIPITLEQRSKNDDLIIRLKNNLFFCEVKKYAKNANYGVLISSIHRNLKDSLIIADYLSKDTAERLKESGVNYLDRAGNAHIKTDNIFLYVEGRKARINKKNNQSRAFAEAGLKLLLLFITNPESLQFNYREIAARTDIALGSVSNIINELEEENFLLKTTKGRTLKHRDELIRRWVTAYNETIKPRVFRRKMRSIEQQRLSDQILDHSNIHAYLGGEGAGAIMTGYLKAQDFTIYSDMGMATLAKTLKLVPDELGNVEIYHPIWTKGLILNRPNIAPPLIVYADLLANGNSRNIETAKMIMENGL